jgi:hypothetical protein
MPNPECDAGVSDASNTAGGSFLAFSRSRQLLQKCTGGTTSCSGTCVDLKKDAMNCGK